MSVTSPSSTGASRADLVADAALALLAERGMCGLTHRAVDEAAGLPQGSTSNVARTSAGPAGTRGTAARGAGGAGALALAELPDPSGGPEAPADGLALAVHRP